MSWTYTFHRFEDRTVFEKALATKGWIEGVPEHLVALDVLGTLFRQGEATGSDPETGEPVYSRIERSGWHVNAAWNGEDMPPEFKAAEVFPVTPNQVFFTG
ncbi:hypothetical protein [Roseococcus sp.]|uniref:hypothetical protein n=1 Tax=Roseococcus sp. TaxID=2109646 RepID=UPI003BAB3AC7